MDGVCICRPDELADDIHNELGADSQLRPGDTDRDIHGEGRWPLGAVRQNRQRVLLIRPADVGQRYRRGPVEPADNFTATMAGDVVKHDQKQHHRKPGNNFRRGRLLLPDHNRNDGKLSPVARGLCPPVESDIK